MKIISKSADIAGRTLTLEVGRFAEQATAAVWARYGDTSVLATVVTRAEETKLDYFPLTVDYQERLYAGGRIKGSRWVKREGRSTDAEILSGRLIDRSIRPLFPKGYKRDVQVTVMVLSVDVDNDPDIVGIVATSAAIAISPVPWGGPVGAVRVGLEEGKLLVNPVNGNRQNVDLDLVISSSEKLIPMIEAGARQIEEAKVFEAIELGFAENQKIIQLINELVGEVGAQKIVISPRLTNPELVKRVEQAAKSKVEEFLGDYSHQRWDEVRRAISDGFAEEERLVVNEVLEDVLHKTIRRNLLEKKKRIDGRKVNEIRPLAVEVGVLPRVHGSATFSRGQTQALTIVTLGSPSLSQSLESAEGEGTKRYMHHYNFPPFSTGETGRVGFPSRREIGHGALAEKAIYPVIPPDTQFPYAIRVVSEIMSSNGSTSMAAVCGSTLALMDAGVPIDAPVSGISVGLVTPPEYPEKMDGYMLMTDIIGLEDHHTDMDFKVAGTSRGITAIQLDVKVPGLTLSICKEALDTAQGARKEILDKMLLTLANPRSEISAYAPKITSTQIPVERIGELIGPGGKIIKKLMAETETVVDVNDLGVVFVTGMDQTKVQEAIAWIDGLFREVAPGEVYEGTVVRIEPFGAFVNILPGKDGLVHVSQMSTEYVGDPNQLVQMGQKVSTRVIKVDETGRVSLTMLSPEDEAAKTEAGGSRSGGSSGGSGRGGGGGGYFRSGRDGRNSRRG